MKSHSVTRFTPDAPPGDRTTDAKRHIVVQVEGDDMVVERVNAALAQAGMTGRVLFGGEMPDPSQLERLNAPNDRLPAESRSVLAAALARGERQLVRWTQDATLIEGARLAEAWSLSRQALDAARRRRELYSLRVKGRHWYPAEFLNFTRPQLADINRALGAASASHKTLFFLRGHGALGGMTPTQAVQAGRLQDVLRIADAWTGD
jgi:hypothetical protein